MAKSDILSRSDLMELEIARYRKDNQPTKNEVDAIVNHHRAVLNVPRISWTRYWVCDSYNNLGIYCVYDDDTDRLHDSCLYCGHPEERK